MSNIALVQFKIFLSAGQLEDKVKKVIFPHSEVFSEIRKKGVQTQIFQDHYPTILN